MKYRQQPKYDLSDSVEIRMNDRLYYVWLKSETVVGQVFGRNGKTFLRLVKSREIETAAIIRASDKFHA